MKTLLLSLACAALAATASAYPAATYRVSESVGYGPRGAVVASRAAVIVRAPVYCNAQVYYHTQPGWTAPRPVFYGRPEVACERVSYGHWLRPGYPRGETRVLVRR